MPWVGVGGGWRGVGLIVQTSQSLPTRRLPARPETALAPRLHTPTCHILKLPDTHFANAVKHTHTHTVLYNSEEQIQITPRHVATT